MKADETRNGPTRGDGAASEDRDQIHDQGTAFDRIVAALDAAGREPVHDGAKEIDQQVLARCPAHLPDNNPSLVLTGIEGQALVHCRAGCETHDVMAALDMTLADLFDQGQATYTYDDGRVVTRTADKQFRQQNGKGTSTLYRLAKVQKAVAEGQDVYLVEGEKDVHAAEAVGLVATTAPGGAANFHLVDATPLQGASVRVVVDKDQGGKQWARKVAAKLDGATLTWHQAKEGKDLADHLAAGLTVDDLDPRLSPDGSLDVGQVQAKGKAQRRIRVQRASEIKPKATRWLWAEQDPEGTAFWVALGGLTLLAGREGIGKTTIAYQVAGRITRGELPGAFHGTPQPVIISATEDAWAETVIPRLMAAGADLDRVFRVDAVTPEDAPEAVKLPEDLVELEALIRDEDVALILLDPLMGSISGTLDSHKDHDVRHALEPVSRLAGEAQVSIIGLIHENKAGGADLLNRIIASRAFAAVARGVLYAARNQEVPRAGDVVDKATPARETFLFGQPKNNLERRVPWTLRYHIEGRRVGYDEELKKDIYGAEIVWDGKVTDQLQDIVNRQESEARNADRETAQDRAEDWLVAYLEKHGPTPSAEVKQASEQAGHKPRTLQRAFSKLNGKVISSGRETLWSLSGAGDTHDTSDIRGAGGASQESTTRATRATRDTRQGTGDSGADPFDADWGPAA